MEGLTLTRRERVKAIFSGKEADRTGFWMGNPDRESWPGLMDHCKADNPDDVRKEAVSV